MMRTYFFGAYKNSELTWVSGVLIFRDHHLRIHGIRCPESGRVWATTVGTESANKIPVVGEWRLFIAAGTSSPAKRSLLRRARHHPSVVLTGLLTIHLFLMRPTSTLEPVGEENTRPETRNPVLPVHVCKESTSSCCCSPCS